MRVVALALLAAILAGCQTVPAVPEADPVTQARVDAAMAWVAAHSDLPHPGVRPAVAWVPLADIQSVSAAVQVMLPAALREGTRVGALYDGARIYVPMETRAFTVWGQALLLHEVVHYMQHMSGRRYDCVSAMEQEAYGLMFTYMREHGAPFEHNVPGGSQRFLDGLACRGGATPDLPTWAMADRH